MQSPLTVRPLSRAEVLDVDRRAIEEYCMSGLVLMENAGRGCVEILQSLGCRGPVAICCGKGNNAGDGFVIARRLDLQGVPVRVLLLADRKELRGDAASNYAILAKSDVPLIDLSASPDAATLDRHLARAEWIVDALLGTGSKGAPRPPLDLAIRQMNANPSKKLAVDLPSGLDCDNGQPADPTFRADHTCTFVAPKIGFGNPAAHAFLGQAHIVDIGVPRKLLEEVNFYG